MCLYADEETARPAENDIVCYKVMIMRRACCDNGYALISEYYGFNYRIGKSYLCYDFSKEAERGIARYDNHVVEYGFHSYMKLDGALSHVKDCLGLSFQILVIVKCAIPKGSLMFSATDDGEYCSERIKVIGWETVTNVAKAVSEQRADSIEWKDAIQRPEEPECAEDDAKGIRKIIIAIKSWMSK